MIKFISQDEEWICSIKKEFQKVPNICVDSVDIRNIPRENACFVVPTNSFGLISGDYEYVVRREIFSGISDIEIQHKIKDLGIISEIGSYHIPIGGALSIPYRASCLFLIPVSYATENISESNNVYLSFLAALQLWERIYKDTNKWYNLIVTNHCNTMSAAKSAYQMKAAYDDFISGNYIGIDNT